MKFPSIRGPFAPPHRRGRGGGVLTLTDVVLALPLMTTQAGVHFLGAERRTYTAPGGNGLRLARPLAVSGEPVGPKSNGGRGAVKLRSPHAPPCARQPAGG